MESCLICATSNRFGRRLRTPFARRRHAFTFDPEPDEVLLRHEAISADIGTPAGPTPSSVTRVGSMPHSPEDLVVAGGMGGDGGGEVAKRIVVDSVVELFERTHADPGNLASRASASDRAARRSSERRAAAPPPTGPPLLPRTGCRNRPGASRRRGPEDEGGDVLSALAKRGATADAARRCDRSQSTVYDPGGPVRIRRQTPGVTVCRSLHRSKGPTADWAQ